VENILRIVYKKFLDWPIKIQEQLKKLSDSSLKSAIKFDAEILHTFVAFDLSIVLGWATCKRTIDPCFQGDVPVYGIMLMVSKKYRRRGIGTELFRTTYAFAKRMKKRIIVYPHDDISTAFFSKMRNS